MVRKRFIMGGHTNYHWLIYTLILMKEELSRMKKEKYQPLIKILEQYEADPKSDNDHLPDHHDIAKMLEYKEPRACKLLKDLHVDLIQDYMSNPIIIKDFVHVIHIHFPWDERNEMKRRDKNHPFLKEYTRVSMKLPFTPRIGEEIRLDFLHLKEFTHGHVHSVQHEIDGVQQRIYLEVHPIHHEYYRFKKLERDYEYHERQRRRRDWDQ